MTKFRANASNDGVTTFYVQKSKGQVQHYYSIAEGAIGTVDLHAHQCSDNLHFAKNKSGKTENNCNAVILVFQCTYFTKILIEAFKEKKDTIYDQIVTTPQFSVNVPPRTLISRWTIWFSCRYRSPSRICLV